MTYSCLPETGSACLFTTCMNFPNTTPSPIAADCFFEAFRIFGVMRASVTLFVEFSLNRYTDGGGAILPLMGHGTSGTR